MVCFSTSMAVRSAVLVSPSSVETIGIGKKLNIFRSNYLHFISILLQTIHFFEMQRYDNTSVS